jgi:hypothetical protein
MKVVFVPDDDRRIWIGIGVNTMVFGYVRNRIRGSDGQPVILSHTIALSIAHYVTRSRFLIFASRRPLDVQSRFRHSRHLIVQCPDEELARDVFDQMLFGPSPYTCMRQFEELLNKIAYANAYTRRDRVSATGATCYMYFAPA